MTRVPGRVWAASIGAKTLAFFLVLFLVLTSLAVYSIEKGRDYIVEAVGTDSAHYASFVASAIDRTIYLKGHELLQIGGDALLGSWLNDSNVELDAMADTEAYLAEVDAEWTSTPLTETTPLMEEILANNVSERVRVQLVEHYIEEHALMIYSSVTVLNKYGAVVGMSARSTDYWFGDSPFWPALLEEGYYFGEVEQDPMTDTHGLRVITLLNDPEGNAIGAMMAFLNIIGVVDESVFSGGTYSSTQLRVISNDGRMIYSEGVLRVFEDVSDQDYFRSITDLGGYFLARESDRDRLYAYASSSGYLSYDGGDWVVLIDHETSEVLQPVEDLRTSMIMASAVVIILSLVLYQLFAHSISRRLRTLAKTAEGYSRGDLGARVDVRSTDEIGQLAKAFNSMAGELGILYRDLEGRVQSRTEELEQAMKKLQLLGSITRHDALNQVAVVMGWTALAEDSTDDKDLLIKLGKITEAAANLERYLKFTGTYERVGVKEPEWMELGSALTESMFGLGPKEFEIHNGLSGVQILADPMFPKVLRNLLDNTVEHGGTVTRASFTYSEGPDGLLIVYEDDGVGIPVDMKESIFESRARSGRASFGLYLSTEILSITGMTFKETGEPGKGARFEILVQSGYYRVDGAPSQGA